MKSVKQILGAKGHDVWSIGPDARVFDAIAQMAEKEVGALMVTDRGRLIGVISERDYARKVILKERSSKETFVKQIMTTRVIYVHPDDGIQECMALMTQA